MLKRLNKNNFELGDNWKQDPTCQKIDREFEVFYPELELSKKIHIHGFRSHIHDYENRIFKRITGEIYWDYPSNLLFQKNIDWEVTEYSGSSYIIKGSDLFLLEDVYQELIKKENRIKKINRVLNA